MRDVITPGAICTVGADKCHTGQQRDRETSLWTTAHGPRFRGNVGRMDDDTRGDTRDDTRTELDELKIGNQSDVQRMWELLMQPLGFRSTSVWVTFIGVDDRPTRFLVEIPESEHLPDPLEVANLFDVLEQVCAEEGEGTSVAFLVTRPGRDSINAFDRDLAARLVAGARASHLHCHPIHVANDLAVRAVAPDDLAA